MPCVGHVECGTGGFDVIFLESCGISRIPEREREREMYEGNQEIRSTLRQSSPIEHDRALEEQISMGSRTFLSIVTIQHPLLLSAIGTTQF